MTIAKVIVPANVNIAKIMELCGAEPFSSGIDKNGNLSIVGVTQEALDAALVSYNSDLEQYELKPVRDAKKESISIEAHKYIGKSYPSFRRELFIALAEEARNAGLTNRVVYINQLLIWVKTIVVITIVAGDEIDAETDIQTINNYDVDFTQFDVTNPNVTVKATLGIED
jgi:hypothetical protein